MDWPSAYYWRELTAFYPQAKVVLTYRTAESWWKTFEQTIAEGIQREGDGRAGAAAGPHAGRRSRPDL